MGRFNIAHPHIFIKIYPSKKHRNHGSQDEIASLERLKLEFVGETDNQSKILKTCFNLEQLSVEVLIENTQR